MKKFFKDFKDFISKGNIFDMAIGVIIGGAFTPIVSSLVNDIIMPPLGLLVGGKDFSELKVVIKEAVGEDPAVTINYGNFISVVLNFLIIAFVIFLIIRLIVKAKAKLEALTKKPEEKPEEPAAPAEPVETEADILKDIRELLKKQ